MQTKYPVSQAEPADASGIALLFALSWTSPFTQLQFGHVDPPTLAQAMAPRIEEHMGKLGITYMVARDPNTKRVIAAAQWKSPVEDVENPGESEQDREERQRFEDESYRNRLPEKSNKALIMEFTVGLRKLREQALGSRKHYLLENIATHPDYRGQGLASRLIEWVFPKADEEGVEVYLDTASDNNAMRLYKKLGFEERDSNTISDLSRFGGEGDETHVALIRRPRENA